MQGTFCGSIVFSRLLKGVREMKSTLWCLVIALAVMAIPTIGLAQRDLKLDVTFKNPNPYGLSVRFTAFHTKGSMNCERDPRDTRSIEANSVVKISCVAQKVREVRNVGLLWTARAERLGRDVCSAELKVLSNRHDFHCKYGCTVKENWSNCGATGDCRASVTVTMDRYAE